MEKISKSKSSISFLITFISIILYTLPLHSQQHIYDYIRLNAFNQKHYTIETKHFRLHYSEGLKHVAEEIGDILERLYDIYRNRYDLTLPTKTEVLVTDDDESGGWALTIKNTINIWSNDFDWNLRGNTNWLENVVAHEYAHIVSIWSSFKMPAWMPYVQFGYFTHPNTKKRIEAFHLFPSEILPPWFFEGIAQYESTVNKGDRWDTHRDMILRTLTLSDKLLSWNHMSVFAGKGDDYEKTYNHGFSLVRYIADTYGYEKVVSMLRESSKLGRLNFDRAIEATLGISGRDLYGEWSTALKKQYTKQIDSIGEQVYGRKINKEGYDNYWPRFSPDNGKIYFLSNGTHDYSLRSLYSYSLSDTVAEKKRIRIEIPEVRGFYDIHAPSRRIVYSSRQSKKSNLPPRLGGRRVRDIFIDTLPSPEKKKRLFSKKTKRQITEKQHFFHAVFSPSGGRLACTKREIDKFYLLLADTSGKILKTLYPSKKHPALAIKSIYSIDWSPNGKRIAVSYMDRDDRKIGIFNTSTGDFLTLCNTVGDERDPRFGPDGKEVYFSSDRTGIFNIYRYNFENGILQRITNVSGGAFTPDVSSDEKKLIYANYDANGYGIYLIDSIKVIEEIQVDSNDALAKRSGIPPKKLSTMFSVPKKYLKMPRQFIFIPSFFSEQIISQDDDAFEGVTHFKLGGVINLVDPIYWAEKGSNIGAFFLVSPDRFLFDRQEIINRKATYDLGIFGYTRALPVDLQIFYIQRSIAGKDVFSHDYFGEDTLETLDYNLNPSFVDLVVSHWVNNFFSLNLLASYNQFKVWVQTSLPGDIKYFDYVPTKGTRLGAYIAMAQIMPDSKMNISPKVFAFKMKYEYWNQLMQNEVNSFTFSGGTIEENYVAPYKYHQFSSSFKLGKAIPWFRKHDIYTELDFSAVKLTSSSEKELQKDVDDGFIPSVDIPSYMQPAAWIPGYSFYYKDTLENVTHEKGSSLPPDTNRIYMDTALISGSGILSGNISYRFPLYPGLIDKKLGFIYLSRLYGALNFGGAAAVNKLSYFKDLHWQDILFYRGVELRLEAITFNTFPLAISARWDYGIDRKAPIGGHKFTLYMGFNFDNWDIIVEPDGQRFFPRYSF